MTSMCMCVVQQFENTLGSLRKENLSNYTDNILIPFIIGQCTERTLIKAIFTSLVLLYAIFSCCRSVRRETTHAGVTFYEAGKVVTETTILLDKKKGFWCGIWIHDSA